MSLQKSLIAHDHRPILDRLPSGIRFATGTGSAAHLAPQNDQLMSKRRVLCRKPQLRLE
jgi:hypothetical protein